MNEIRSVYLIGLGAIGGAFAGRIQEHVPGSPKIIVNAERADRYDRTGIKINGVNTGFSYVQPEDIEEPADLLLIFVKHHHLDQTVRDIRKAVGPDTIILSLLNGITSEDIIGREYGMDKLLYSFCVGTDAVRTGTDINYSNIGRIVFGDKTDSDKSEKVRVVRDFFDRAHVPYAVPENIMRELWWKFMLNVGINQISAILKAPYKLFTVAGEARDLMIAASREVVEISRGSGAGLDQQDLEKAVEILKTLSPSGKTSMLQDVEAGRKTEVEIFAGAVMELGAKYGVKTPVNHILYRIIKAMEQSAQSGANPDREPV